LTGPRTKRSLSPFRLPKGDILLARDVFGLGLSLKDDEAGTLWTLLRLADGRRDLADLTKALQATRPGVSREAVQTAVDRLVALGVLEEAATEGPTGFSAPELDRYSRNLDFLSLLTLGSPRTALSLQRQLKRARVTILGVGAVGSATATSLAAAGVGHLRLIDPDRVETSNLNRQLLYRTSDVGRSKVHAAADHLKALNPHLAVTAEEAEVTGPADVPPLLEGCDLFVLGADRPHEILLWTNDAAQSRGVPWLENSYSGPRVALALFVPGKTPCLRCLQHHLETDLQGQGIFEGTNLEEVPSANAVVAPTAGVAGHYGALRALYYLTDLRHEDDGALLQLNLWKWDDVRVVRPAFWAECPACGDSTTASRPKKGRP
jgi:molybdopterin/thiamine biosynthesis adenylyltransferase